MDVGGIEIDPDEDQTPDDLGGDTDPTDQPDEDDARGGARQRDYVKEGARPKQRGRVNAGYDNDEGMGMRDLSGNRPTREDEDHETSFMNEDLEKRLERQADAAKAIKDRYPKADLTLFAHDLDPHGQVIVKLFRDNSPWHLLSKVVKSGKPQTIFDALGPSKEEVDVAELEEAEAKEGGRRAKLEESRKAVEEAPTLEQRSIAEANVEADQESLDEATREVESIKERMPLKERVKAIFKKHGLTVTGVLLAVGTTIGVIVSNLSNALAKVAKGVGNGLKDLGKKVAQILPGMVGSIVSFLFKTAGEAVGFLAKHAWVAILGLVWLAVDQLKAKHGR